MSKRSLAITLAVLAAVVLVTIVVASSVGSGSGGEHMMPGGETMKGDNMTMPSSTEMKMP